MLEGQTALVTGASRGIGRAIALRLAKDGARVAVNYRSREDLAAEVVRSIQDAGGQAIMVQGDVRYAEQVLAMVTQVREQFGPVQILVNNAGVLYRGDLDEFDPDRFDEMVQVNINGIVHCIRAVKQDMIERRYGRIVNLSSIAGHGTAMRGTSFYAVTKAAVSLLTRRFAMELGPYGITVNAIAPGFVLTEMVAQGRTPEQVEQLKRNIAELAMVKRIGTPEDMAHAVSFLVSPDSSFITAQVITVDGGRMDYISHP